MAGSDELEGLGGCEGREANSHGNANAAPGAAAVARLAAAAGCAALGLLLWDGVVAAQQ